MIKRRDEHRKLIQEAKEDRLQSEQIIKLIGEGKWTDFGDIRSSAYSRYVEALNDPTFTVQHSHPIIKQLIERLGPNGFPIKVTKKSKKKEGGVKDDREYHAFEQHQRQLKSKSESEKKTAPKDTAKTKKTAPKDTAKKKTRNQHLHLHLSTQMIVLLRLLPPKMPQMILSPLPTNHLLMWFTSLRKILGVLSLTMFHISTWSKRLVVTILHSLLENKIL